MCPMLTHGVIELAPLDLIFPRKYSWIKGRDSQTFWPQYPLTIYKLLKTQMIYVCGFYQLIFSILKVETEKILKQ